MDMLRTCFWDCVRNPERGMVLALAGAAGLAAAVGGGAIFTAWLIRRKKSNES